MTALHHQNAEEGERQEPVSVTGTSPFPVFSSGAAITVLAGLLFGSIFFCFCLLVPDHFRGVTFGDSADYMAYSRGPLSQIFQHSNHRLFGYPFFLGIFRHLIGAPNDNSFLSAAMTAQLVAAFGSSLLLVYALRKADLKVPAFAIALLLMHPALISMSTIAMTDSLTSSLFSTVIALSTLIVSSQRWLVLKALLLGLSLSVSLSFRPSMLPYCALIPVVVGGSLVLKAWRAAEQRARIVRLLSVLFAFYAIGFLPIYTVLRVNCYRAHNEQCVMPNKELNRGMHTSFGFALVFSRVDIFFRMDGVPVDGSTQDQVFPLGSCQLSKEEPTQSYLSCYLKNWKLVPLHLSRRLIGVLDHRHLNLYAGLYTPEWVFISNRLFSAMGFVGVVFCLVLYIRCLLNKQPGVHFLLPLIYTAVQVNFHPEARYMFPVVGFYFVIAVSILVPPPFPRMWKWVLTWGCAASLMYIYCHLNHQWDLLSFARFGHY
jgi:hypothetical protein